MIIIPNTALPTEQAVPVNFPAVSNESAAAVNEMDISDEETFIFQADPSIPTSTAMATTSSEDYVDAGEEYIIYYSSDDDSVVSPRTRRINNEAEFYVCYPDEYQEYLEASAYQDSPPAPEITLEEIEMERQLTLHYRDQFLANMLSSALSIPPTSK